MNSVFLKRRMNESGDLDTGTIAGLIFLLLVFGCIYFFIMFPEMRGPAADVEVNVGIEPSGLISQYKVTLQFVDDMSYSKFLSTLNSPKIQSMEDYEFRTFSSSQFFSLTNDSSSRRVTIEAKRPFDPNNTTLNIRVKKNSDFWEFEDNSITNSSHVPEKYINKLTYSLTIPSELIYANTYENSTSWISDGTQLTWHIDRDKNPLNPTGNNLASPVIYAKFETPAPILIPRIFILVGVFAIILLLAVFILRRGNSF